MHKSSPSVLLLFPCGGAGWKWYKKGFTQSHSHAYQVSTHCSLIPLAAVQWFNHLARSWTGCSHWGKPFETLIVSSLAPSSLISFLSYHSLQDNIPDSVIKAIQPYIDNQEFQPAAIAKVSKACTSICQWVRAMHKYHFVAKVVEPKRVRGSMTPLL